MFKYGVIYSALVIISFFIGLPFGPVGVATSYSICILLVFIPWLHYACKGTPVDVPSILKTLWRTAFATLAVGVALALFKMAQPALAADALGLVVGFIGTVVIFMSVLCALAQSLDPIREVVNLAALARGQKQLNKTD